ncbi:MAG: cell division protein ZapA (FtsZ GTPase activity inhibitor), partial [Urechidicola sp.]
NVIDMQTKVNALKKVQDNLGKMMSEMKKKSPEMDTTSVLFMSGIALIKKLKSWDEEMVQRKSQAYDDVENFENKFTADYLFLINQTDSDLPRVNKSSIDRRTELDGMWALLKNQADVLINNDIPAYNKMLWEAGIGALMVE